MPDTRGRALLDAIALPQNLMRSSQFLHDPLQDCFRGEEFEEESMGNRFAFRLLIGVVALGMFAVVGVYSYNLGEAHGLAQNGHPLATPGAGPPFVYWPHPWAFGFFPFFPLLFILFFVFILRGLFWRGWGGPRWGHWYGGVPPAFEEWHRRAHAQPGSPSGPNA